jgi:hypothetical protein
MHQQELPKGGDSLMGKKKEAKSWKCMRKITPTHSNGRLINLGGMIPKDWSYADVFILDSNNDSVTIQISVIRRVGDGARNTGELPRATQTIKPTI